MATLVYFDGIWDYDNTTYIFRAINRGLENLWVKSFENGIATVDPMCGCSITSFAETVAGCFDRDSNFAHQLLTAYNADMDAVLKGIQFDFNGVTLLVTEENADKDKILKEWNAGMEANAEKSRREREAYMKTPEYRAKRAKELKVAVRKEKVQKDVLSVDETAELQFKDEQAASNWEQFVEVNSKDGYSNGVVTYARRWAKYMQHLMEKHNKSVIQIAEQASFVSDVEGITGFMYGCAVNVLSQTWKYGEELRKWHNKDYGYEGDGVVNPAVLTIG